MRRAINFIQFVSGLKVRHQNRLSLTPSSTPSPSPSPNLFKAPNNLCPSAEPSDERWWANRGETCYRITRARSTPDLAYRKEVEAREKDRERKKKRCKTVNLWWGRNEPWGGVELNNEGDGKVQRKYIWVALFSFEWNHHHNHRQQQDHHLLERRKTKKGGWRQSEETIIKDVENEDGAKKRIRII